MARVWLFDERAFFIGGAAGQRFASLLALRHQPQQIWSATRLGLFRQQAGVGKEPAMARTGRLLWAALLIFGEGEG